MASFVVVFMPNVPFKYQLQLVLFVALQTLSNVLVAIHFQFPLNILNRMVFMQFFFLFRCKNAYGHLHNPDACIHSWLGQQVKELQCSSRTQWCSITQSLFNCLCVSSVNTVLLRNQRRQLTPNLKPGASPGPTPLHALLFIQYQVHTMHPYCNLSCKRSRLMSVIFFGCQPTLGLSYFSKLKFSLWEH